MLGSPPFREGAKGAVFVRYLIRLVMVITLVLSLTQVVAAASIDATVQSPGKPSLVLPFGNELDKDQMEAVKGEGLLAAFTGAAAGAFGAALSYTVDYAWDRYADDTVESWFGEPDLEGDADNDRNWCWSDFYSSTFQAAGTGFIGGFFLP
jgi:hypothetical protein